MDNFNKALEENRSRYQARKKQYEMEQKRKERKEWILFMFIATFIIILVSLVLNGMAEETDRAYSQCINEGHSIHYCARTI